MGLLALCRPLVPSLKPAWKKMCLESSTRVVQRVILHQPTPPHSPTRARDTQMFAPPLRALGDYPVRTAPTEVPCPWLSGWVLPIRGADRKPEGPRREAGVFPFPPALGRCGLQVAALQHRSPPLTPRCSPPNSSFLPKGWLAAWCHPILCRVLHPAQSPKTSLRKCCR